MMTDVKNMTDTARLAKRIDERLEELGLRATNEQLNLLAMHLEMVVRKNETLNLTRITDMESAIVLHVVDSLLLLQRVTSAPDGPLVDIGTGAGYPGIPLAVMTGRPTLLIDSVGKKTRAVNEFIERLGLDDQVLARQIRAEELARTDGECFSVVTARAVAQTSVLVEYAAPLLAMGGCLVLTKGQLSKGELESGKKAGRLCGLKYVSRETYELPDDRGHREILTFEKAVQPRIKLPRKVGMAQHHPLGM